MVNVPQNVPICLGLSAMGGIIEVFATALLAVADAQTKEGIVWTKCWLRLALVGNVVLQVSASMVGNLLAPWFGPVSLVAPTFLAAQLLANMVLYGVVLGLESFTKDMRIGTYVIVIGAVLLPVVGPAAQDDQAAWDLLTRPFSATWSLILVIAMIASATLMTLALSCKGATDPREHKPTYVDMDKRFPNVVHRIVILLVARATSFTINLTVSKVMILDVPKYAFIIALILKILSGAVMTFGIVVQSTSVPQGTFVPLNATFTIIVNALTGIIIWEDWKVMYSIDQWIGYGCVFLLFALGCYLLLGDDVSFLDSDNFYYGLRETIRFVGGRSRMLRNVAVSILDTTQQRKSMVQKDYSDAMFMGNLPPKGDTSTSAMHLSTRPRAKSLVYGGDISAISLGVGEIQLVSHSQSNDMFEEEIELDVESRGDSLSVTSSQQSHMSRKNAWREIYNVDEELIQWGPRHHIKTIFFQNGSARRVARDQGCIPSSGLPLTILAPCSEDEEHKPLETAMPH
jgi:hypothetical protein